MIDSLIKVSCIFIAASLIPQVFVLMANDPGEKGVDRQITSPLSDDQIAVTIQRAREFTGTSFTIQVGIEGMIAESALYQGIEVFPNWTVTQEIMDPKEKILVSVHLSDLVHRSVGYMELDFDMRTGDWTGTDFRGDMDGYGHVLGDTFEVWFDISIKDMDADGLATWEELYVYGTDPLVDDRGRDDDGDGIPIDWEDHWGYDPFMVDAHDQLDPDNDGLVNLDEYRMRHWFSDPYRQDVFVEVDWMHGNYFWEKPYCLSNKAKHMVMTAFARQNILLNIDDGWMGGGEEIPFYGKDELNLNTLYRKYFLGQFTDIWKQGIFHYAILMGVNPWKEDIAGFNFQSDAFTVCIGTIRLFRIGEAARILATAGIFMHELGHNLGLFQSDFAGIDNQNTRYPWQEDFWVYGGYHSCMNYRYAWHYVDYSHGTQGEYDYDDWGNLNLKHFLD
jgi:hypothetical protein